MSDEAEWSDEVWQIDQAIEDAKRFNRLDSQIARLVWLRDNIDELVASRGKVAMAEAALGIAAARLAVLSDAVREQIEYLERLKHRAKVRGGPDTSAMCIADEAIVAARASMGAEQ